MPITSGWLRTSRRLILSLALITVSASVLIAAETPGLVERRDTLTNVFNGILHSLKDSGLPSKADFQSQALAEAKKLFQIDPNFKEFTDDDKKTLNLVASDVYDAFTKKNDAPGQPDPFLKQQENLLFGIFQNLAHPSSKSNPTQDQLAADAVNTALMFLQAKNPSLAKLDPASEKYVRDLAGKASSSPPPTPPAPNPPGPDNSKASVFDASTRASLVFALRVVDSDYLQLQQDNGVKPSDSDRENNLLKRISQPGGTFLTNFQRLTKLSSVADLSAADHTELTEKMIPEAMDKNTTGALGGGGGSPKINQPSDDSDSLGQELVELGDEVGSVFGVPYAGELGEVAYDGLVLIGRSRLFQNCRAKIAGRRSRAVILQGTSAPSTSRYILVPAN